MMGKIIVEPDSQNELRDCTSFRHHITGYVNREPLLGDQITKIYIDQARMAFLGAPAGFWTSDCYHERKYKGFIA